MSLPASVLHQPRISPRSLISTARGPTSYHGFSSRECHITTPSVSRVPQLSQQSHWSCRNRSSNVLERGTHPLAAATIPLFLTTPDSGPSPAISGVQTASPVHLASFETGQLRSPNALRIELVDQLTKSHIARSHARRGHAQKDHVIDWPVHDAARHVSG
jgi:hypothetical protein